MISPFIIAEAIGKKKLLYNNEMELQELLAQRFTDAEIKFEREYRLTKKERVDFLIDCTAVEIKMKAPAAQIMRQLMRYAIVPAIDSVIIIVPRPMSLPPTFANKPIYCVAIWRNLI